MNVKFKILTIIILSSIFYSCGGANTVGVNKKYPKTDHIDLIWDINNITKDEYVEIGYIESDNYWDDKDKMIKDMVEKAKDYGADALVKIQFIDKNEQIYSNNQLSTITFVRASAIMIKYKKNIKPKE